MLEERRRGGAGVLGEFYGFRGIRGDGMGCVEVVRWVCRNGGVGG